MKKVLSLSRSHLFGFAMLFLLFGLPSDVYAGEQLAGKYRVASFIPGNAPMAAEFSGMMQSRGMIVTSLNISDLNGVLTPGRFDAVLFAGANTSIRLDADMKAALLNFLRAGGDMVLLGAELPSLAENRNTLAVELFREDDPANDYRDAVKIAAVEGVNPWMVLEKPISGRFSGTSALGPAVPNQVDFVPLLAAQDQYGRTMGWAGGMLVNFAGPFKGGRWAVFRVNEGSFYAGRTFLVGLVSLLQRWSRSDIAGLAAEDDARRRAVNVRLTSLEPQRGFVRVGPGGKQLEVDGKPLFVTGCFYDGGMTRGMATWGGEAFDAGILLNDFATLRDYGINGVRIFGDAGREMELKEVLRRHQVYLLYEMMLFGTVGKLPKTVEEMAVRAREVALRWKDEVMLLAYDLGNEPYLYYFAALTLNGKPSPLVAARPYDNPRFRLLLERGPFGRPWVDDAVRNLPAWIYLPPDMPPEQLREILAGYAILLNYAKMEGWQSTGIGTARPFTRKDDKVWQEFLSLADESVRLVIDKLISAIREVDQNHLITVGYNNIAAFLPANQVMDFNSFHYYIDFDRNVPIFRNARELVEASDLLGSAFPRQPVTRGEFGISTGYREDFDSGPYWRDDASGILELAAFVRDFNQGYSGIWRWLCDDQYLPLMPLRWPWRDWKLDATDVDTTRQARFGIFRYDGTISGRPKPLAHALRFLRRAVDEGLKPGEFQLTRTPVFPYLGFTFQSPGTIIIGNVEGELPEIEFKSENVAGVFLRWGSDGAAEISSTADVHVNLALDRIFGQVPTDDIGVTGTRGKWSIRGGVLSMEMLAGETATLAVPSAHASRGR